MILGASRFPHRWMGFFLGTVGVFSLALLVHLTGCGGSSGTSAPSIPEGKGKRLFTFEDAVAEKVVLRRGGVNHEFSPSPGFVIVENDTLRNTSGKTLYLKGIEDDCRFFIKPSGTVDFFDKAITLHLGNLRMDFRKLNGEFKVKIPFATIGIRGTTLVAAVNPDGTSDVFMLEGSVSVKTISNEITLEKGKKLSVGGNGKESKVADLTADEFLSLGTDGENVKLWRK